LRQNQDLALRVLQLDRENERALLRHKESRKTAPAGAGTGRAMIQPKPGKHDG
jgi:hypothetical protein